MKCLACGTAMPAEAAFCPQCGARTGETAPPKSDPGPAQPFRRALGNDEVEEELWAGSYCSKAMIGSWMLGLLVTIGLIVAGVMLTPPAMLVCAALVGVVWLVLVLIYVYRKLNFHYELTSQRFIHKVGILSRRSDRIEVIDIDDVTFQQGLVERMFDVGTIKVVSSDRTHPELILIGIDGVKQVADLIDDARRKERRKRGVHIESI